MYVTFPRIQFTRWRKLDSRNDDFGGPKFDKNLGSEMSILGGPKNAIFGNLPNLQILRIWMANKKTQFGKTNLREANYTKFLSVIRNSEFAKFHKIYIP